MYYYKKIMLLVVIVWSFGMIGVSGFILLLVFIDFFYRYMGLSAGIGSSCGLLTYDRHRREVPRREGLQGLGALATCRLPC
jgi:hypothetical protein